MALVIYSGLKIANIKRAFAAYIITRMYSLLNDSGTKEARHSFTSLWDLGAPAAKVCVQAAFAVVIMCERAEPDGIGAEFSALKHNASCFIAIC